MHYLSSVYFVNQPHTTTNTELAASIRLYQIAALVLYSFTLMFLYRFICLLSVAKFYVLLTVHIDISSSYLW